MLVGVLVWVSVLVGVLVGVSVLVGVLVGVGVNVWHNPYEPIWNPLESNSTISCS